MFLELENDSEELVCSIVGKMGDEHVVVCYILDMEVEEQSIMDFGSDYMELGHELGFEPERDYKWPSYSNMVHRHLVTGSADPELRFYTVKHDLVDGKLIANKSETDVNKDLDTENKWEVLKLFGEIQRQSNERVATVRFNTTGNLLACQVAGKMVEVFCVLNESESKRKAKRRISTKKCYNGQ
ncbi:hypothetical protein CQW23_21996 [Capsicum baccatum]|uniref:Uncharacterized protein n=1 Tax=Capsicum baccatum TaxID=33114 RepID=A0A2G2VZQ0_CAPBA|nr:hypothetical protein CQW23_21996 [Capsicum baccatum]